MTEPNDPRRLALVIAAQRQWTDALTDLGGRNTLLYYKDRRAGTLDLAAADPDTLEKFEKTGSIRLTKLFSDADIRADAIRRAQAIYRKARELTEERGIRAGYLATGLARWDELFLEPAAPVLLRGLTIAPTRARYDDFDLILDDEVEVNPVLLHKLATVFGAVIESPHPDRIAAQLVKAAAHAEIPGFAIEKRKVIGTFTYAKLPMVRDLEAAGDLLADSDLVAAIAGDAEAQRLVSSASDTEEPATDDPEEDYSILDADSSQRSAIDAVLSGRSLVIHGPPGTGKSQTIANLIAAMVARGRKVLFVAEKRAAIDAVLSRLAVVGLADLVLDIHEGARDRQRIAADLGATLDVAEHATVPDTSALRRRLTDRRQRLTRHAAALHRAHEPWRLSPYQVQSALLGVSAQARVRARLAAPEEITPELADQIRDELREFARLGGFALRPGASPWFGAALRTREQSREAVELAVALSTRTLPLVAARLAAACSEVGLRIPADYSERSRATHLFDLLHDAGAAGKGFRERRALRRQARVEWDTLRASGPASEPRLPSEYAVLVQAWRECERQLDALRALAPLAGLTLLAKGGDPEAATAALAADQKTPWKLPRLRELARRFETFGLVPLLDEIGSEAVPPDVVADSFDYAWYRSILDQIRVRDADYAAEYGAALDEIAEEFRQRDIEHLAANRSRVRSAWALQILQTVAAPVTGTGCARSTWSASAGGSTGSGPQAGSPTLRENWPSSARPTPKPSAPTPSPHRNPPHPPHLVSSPPRRGMGPVGLSPSRMGLRGRGGSVPPARRAVGHPGQPPRTAHLTGMASSAVRIYPVYPVPRLMVPMIVGHPRRISPPTTHDLRVRASAFPGRATPVSAKHQRRYSGGKAHRSDSCDGRPIALAPGIRRMHSPGRLHDREDFIPGEGNSSYRCTKSSPGKKFT